MPSVAQKFPVPGVWALGTITIAHGVPAAITSNVGSQSQGTGGTGSLVPTSRPFTSLVAQLIFSCPTANTGDVFVNFGNFAGTPDTNATVLVVPKGATLSLPVGSPLVAGAIDPDSFYLDGTTSDKCVVTAIYAN